MASQDPRRRIYVIFTVIILLTLPCYCAGLIAVALAPERPNGGPGTPATIAPPGFTLVPASATPTGNIPPISEPTSTATTDAVPILTLIAGSPTSAVSTPTQFVPPTRTQTNTPTSTPTNTSTPTPTVTPTGTTTSTPTVTSTGEPTATASATPTPTASITAIPATATPTFTAIPPTETASPTAAPPTETATVTP